MHSEFSLDLLSIVVITKKHMRLFAKFLPLDISLLAFLRERFQKYSKISLDLWNCKIYKTQQPEWHLLEPDCHSEEFFTDLKSYEILVQLQSWRDFLVKSFLHFSDLFFFSIKKWSFLLENNPTLLQLYLMFFLWHCVSLKSCHFHYSYIVH